MILFNARENSPIPAQPKIKFTNNDKSPGLKKGGFLHVVARRVSVLCDGEKSIPEFIEADVASLHVGSKFRAESLKLPNGVKLKKKGNFLIASIVGRGKSEEETPANAQASSTATPASGTTPAKAEDKKDAKK